MLHLMYIFVKRHDRINEISGIGTRRDGISQERTEQKGAGTARTGIGSAARRHVRIDTASEAAPTAMATTTRPAWIAAAERRLAGAPDVVEEAPRSASAAAPPSPRVPETAAPVVTAAALEAEYEAALAAASAVNKDDDDGDADPQRYAAADQVAAAAHRRRGARAAFLTGLGEEPDHELYPNYQHERRLRRAAGESDEAWEKRMLAGSPTRRRRPPGAG